MSATLNGINLDAVTQAFAVPGSLSIIDIIRPDTGRSVINDETLEQIRERYPFAEVVDLDTWQANKAAMQDREIIWDETTEERYNEMLCVLPPAVYLPGGFLVGEPSDHHAVNGRPRFQAFRCRHGRYECASRALTVKEFRQQMEAAK